jgi:hypothetical protein
MAGAGSVGVIQKLEPELVFDRALRTVGMITSDIIDLSQVRRIIVKGKSTLDQDVYLQLIGDLFNPMDIPTLISNAFLLPAGSGTTSAIEIGFEESDWQPYIAIQVTTLVVPTVGQLRIWIAGQA